MNADSTNCSVCSGSIGILPTARSVTCPHCNAYLTVIRVGEEIELSRVEKFADDPSVKSKSISIVRSINST